MVRDIFVIFGRCDFVIKLQTMREEDVPERDADVAGQTLGGLQESRSMFDSPRIGC